MYQKQFRLLEHAQTRHYICAFVNLVRTQHTVTHRGSQSHGAYASMHAVNECMNVLTVLSVQNDSNGAPAPLLLTVYLMTITLPVAYSLPTMIEETTRSGGGLRVTSMGFCNRIDSIQKHMQVYLVDHDIIGVLRHLG